MAGPIDSARIRRLEVLPIRNAQAMAAEPCVTGRAYLHHIRRRQTAGYRAKQMLFVVVDTPNAGVPLALAALHFLQAPRRRRGNEPWTGRNSYESDGDAAWPAAADRSTQLRVLSGSPGALMQAAVIERQVPIDHPARKLEIRLSDQNAAARGDPRPAISSPPRPAAVQRSTALAAERWRGVPQRIVAVSPDATRSRSHQGHAQPVDKTCGGFAGAAFAAVGHAECAEIGIEHQHGQSVHG